MPKTPEGPPQYHRQEPIVQIIDDDKDHNELESLLVGLAAEQMGITIKVSQGTSLGDLRTSLVSEDPADLLLLDVKIAGFTTQDTVTIVQEIKANPKTSDMSIIVLSALTDSETIAQLEEAGIDGYIAKPFDNDHVIERVATIVTAKRESQLQRSEND